MRRAPKFLLATLLATCLFGAFAQAGDDLVLQANEALRQKDLARLGLFREQALAQKHPLASWVDYWDIGARLTNMQQRDLDAFYARWPGTYVEDRLRNDWLLELGKRRDWDNFRLDYPRFRMDDDREVRCYWLLTQHLGGQDVSASALQAWRAQQRDDDGCQLMAQTLARAGKFSADDIWLAVRDAIEANRPRAAMTDADLLPAGTAKRLRGALDNPARYLARQAASPVRGEAAQVALMALMRLAVSDPDVAAAQLGSWEPRLPRAMAAHAWAYAGYRAALRLQPNAAGLYESAWRLVTADDGGVDWSDDMLAWGVRAALRAGALGAESGPRWSLVLRQIDAMAPADQADPSWIYWKARALQATAPSGDAGEPVRAQAQTLLQSIAGQMHFYGKLALEDLGKPITLPATPAPPTPEERLTVRAVPGLQRGLQLIELGLRSEGVREWNFTLRDLKGDRALLAAAQMACEREVWDRCINTSDRTVDQVDLAQRFPMPFKDAVLAQSKEIGLDPAYVFGLIRQESRFITDARSHVGASGLMQLMPATARWTARKIGLDLKAGMVNDRDVNLRLGTSYLKLILDDFEGRMALGAAAYNAGPNRPRRWRDGPLIEAAAWVENIPFNETRDYVKKVLSNAVYYGALIGNSTPSLKQRLGGPVGPRPAGPAVDKDLP